MVGLRYPGPGATGYKVLRSTTAGSGYGDRDRPGPAALRQGSRGRRPYYYVLQSVDAAGPSMNSAERSVVIPGAAKAAAAVLPPEWDKVVPQATTEFGKVNVKVGLFWNPVKGNIAAYNVYRSTTPGADSTLAGSSTETQYVDTAVEVGKTYYYVLSALDAATFVETPYSKEQAVEVKAPEKREKKKQEKIVQKFRVGRVLSTITNGAWGNLSGPSDLDATGTTRSSSSATGRTRASTVSASRASSSRSSAPRQGQPARARLAERPRLGSGRGCPLRRRQPRRGVVMFDGEGVLKGEFTVLKEHGTNIGKENPITVDVCASPDGSQLAVVDNQRHKVLVYDNKGKFEKDLSVGYKSAELGSFTHPTRACTTRTRDTRGTFSSPTPSARACRSSRPRPRSGGPSGNSARWPVDSTSTLPSTNVVVIVFSSG